MYRSKKLEEMHQTASKFAKAKAEATHLEHFRKSKLAILMKQYALAHKTTAAQEREARADPEYIQLLEGMKVAVEEMERLRWELKFIEMNFDKWRTMESTKRAEMKNL